MMEKGRYKSAQSAMEYLMTYGWAILIIAVVLGALFQLGVFNASSFSPRAPPGACQVFRSGGPGTVTNINLMGVCTGQLPQYVSIFSSASSSYISLATYPNPTGSLTLSVWFKAQSTTSQIVLVSHGWTASEPGFTFQIFSHKLTCGVQNQGASAYAQAFGAKTIDDSNWHHAACVFSSGSSLQIYTDGVADGGSAGATGTTDSHNSFGFWIGRDDATRNFNGQLSNYQLYNTSLSTNEIQYLYSEGIGGAPTLLQNLVGWWPLNGNTNDYSGNNNNGVPYNGVTFTSQYGK